MEFNAVQGEQRGGSSSVTAAVAVAAAAVGSEIKTG